MTGDIQNVNHAKAWIKVDVISMLRTTTGENK